MSTVLKHPQRHPVTVEEYLRMGEAEVFPHDARLELIEGEIIDMAPVGSTHAGVVKRLNRLFAERASHLAVVSVQDPVVVSDRSVPQPDLALLKPRADAYFDSHPTAADVLLVVEVADATLAFDVGTKVPLYARCGIPKVWVVDVKGRSVCVYRDPGASGYSTHFIMLANDTLLAIALPGLHLDVREIFPT